MSWAPALLLRAVALTLYEVLLLSSSMMGIQDCLHSIGGLFINVEGFGRRGGRGRSETRGPGITDLTWETWKEGDMQQ